MRLCELFEPGIKVLARKMRLRPSDLAGHTIKKRVLADGRFSQIVLDIKSTSPDMIEITYFENNGPKGQGIASDLIDIMSDVADMYGVSLTLTAHAMRGGMPQQSLEDFYGRRGFVLSNTKTRRMTRPITSGLSTN